MHNSLQSPEHPQGLPAAVVIEHVVIRGTEHGDDGEDALRRAEDQLLHRGAALQLDEVQAASGGRAQPCLAISGASAVPARHESEKSMTLRSDLSERSGSRARASKNRFRSSLVDFDLPTEFSRLHYSQWL